MLRVGKGFGVVFVVWGLVVKGCRTWLGVVVGRRFPLVVLGVVPLLGFSLAGYGVKVSPLSKYG